MPMPIQLLQPLRKPVSALAITPKTGKITALGRKAWNVLLKIAQEQGFDADTFKAPLNEIVAGLDFNSNDLKVIKDHLRSMVSTTVEWQSPTLGETSAWNVCGLLAHATVTKERGATWVEWSFAVNMRHELLDPEVYAKLSLETLAQLNSHAAIALYEICTRYKDVSRSPRQAWQWWRPVLTGRPDDERIQKMEYRHFKRDVIRPAIAELNSIADIDYEIALIEHKQGRFISEMQFSIAKKPQRSLILGGRSGPVDMSLLGEGERLGIDQRRIEQLVSEYGEAAVTAGLEALAKRAAMSFPEPLRDHYRYLKSTMPSHAAAEVKKHEAQIEADSPAARQKVSAERTQQWAQQWITQRHVEITAEIQALPQARVDELVRELLAELERTGAHPALSSTLISRGWWHNLVRAKMISFYATGAYGGHWDKPTPEQVLEVAARG